MEQDLAGPTAEEASSIAWIREKAPQDLFKAAPEDVQHDFSILRFLRGHGNQETALEFYANMLKWRMENKAQLDEYRSAFPKNMDRLDLTLLPHHEKILSFITSRNLSGLDTAGLPLSAIYAGYIDLSGFSSDVTDDEFGEYVGAMLEQRMVLLHNLSVAQNRLMKFVDIRDLDALSVPQFLGNPGVLMRLKSVLKSLQERYPEMIHKVFILNAPSTFSQIFAIFKQILNARMQAKVIVCPINAAFPKLCGLMQAAGTHSWIREATLLEHAKQGNTSATEEIQAEAVQIPAGTMRYRSLWVGGGAEGGSSASVAYTVALKEGADVSVRMYFFPAPAAAAAAAGAGAGGGDGSIFNAAAEAAALQELASVKLSKGDPELSGSAELTGPGACVLVVDNASSWFSAKAVTCSLSAV